MQVNIFGATGLIGNLLLQACLQSEVIKSVKIFVRKPIATQHAKLHQVVTTADTLGQHAHEITGDVVFNCLGTTIKQAGSQAAQYAIDCEYPAKAASLSAANGVSCMINVSSVGASKTGNFYLKTKADMEQKVSAAIGEKAYFLRPSFLLGDRGEVRLGEKIGIYLMVLINPFLIGGLRKYRSIQAQSVAKAMLKLALSQPDEPKILHFDEIMDLGN
jgi:uncharacterized protein YbjT (DUF2867 family)